MTSRRIFFSLVLALGCTPRAGGGGFGGGGFDPDASTADGGLLEDGAAPLDVAAGDDVLRTVAPLAVVPETKTETSFEASSPLIQATDALLNALG